jgi:hypothetical protein
VEATASLEHLARILDPAEELDTDERLQLATQALARFERRIQPVADGCHLWSGSLAADGYGQFSLNGRLYLSRRLAINCGAETSEPTNESSLPAACGRASTTATWRRDRWRRQRCPLTVSPLDGHGARPAHGSSAYGQQGGSGVVSFLGWRPSGSHQGQRQAENVLPWGLSTTATSGGASSTEMAG